MMYHRLGEVPKKRHIAFRRPDGSLYHEELIGNKGFRGPSSLLYHLHRPTEVLDVRLVREEPRLAEETGALRHRHFRTRTTIRTDDEIRRGFNPAERTLLLFNEDVAVLVWTPPSGPLYRNGSADELIYVSEGDGVLESQMGELPFGPGDYVVVPRGIIHRWRIMHQTARFLIVESRGHVRTPARYRNEFGQYVEEAPYSERDIRLPQSLPLREDLGTVPLLVRAGGRVTGMVLNHHPFDVVGWDGYYYPWAFNIRDFEPRVGRIHLPPPVHQTFEGDGFVICSFVPRLFDFDPEAVPAPYNHSNAMSDEVIFYASSEFMSRKGIEFGSVTLHPDGIPHGPHPGAVEASIGKPRTDEVAVMIDTFRPLHVAQSALPMEDKEYYRSWVEPR
ncbi:MAG: homogentisate 1,2-dioxygenase [Candidatus Xenobia bacterium]